MKINQKTFKNFLSQYIFYSSYPHPQISFHVLELILVFLAMRTILFFFVLLTLLQLSPFPHLHPPPPSPHLSFPLGVTTLLCVSMCYAHVSFSSSLHLLFHLVPSPPPVAVVSLFHVSMPLLLFCKKICFGECSV